MPTLTFPATTTLLSVPALNEPSALIAPLILAFKSLRTLPSASAVLVNVRILVAFIIPLLAAIPAEAAKSETLPVISPEIIIRPPSI